MKYFGRIVSVLNLLTLVSACGPAAMRSAGSKNGPSAGQLETMTKPQSSEAPIVHISYAKFAADATLNVVSKEMTAPLASGISPQIKVLRIPFGQDENPFVVSPADFNVGGYLPNTDEATTPPPEMPAKQLAWFTRVKQQGQLPDTFIIGGHQVISEGWHDHEETRFMFLPTLLKAVEKNQDVKDYFANVKFAVLGGCNTMTNLEPHYESAALSQIAPFIKNKKDGDYLSPEEIKAIYQSSAAGKNWVIGKSPDPKKPHRWNSLEFYRARLAVEYGPNNIEHYEYTRSSKAEKCDGPGKYDKCRVTNVDRIFPDSGLFDSGHRYNYPWIMKKLFPNSSLVIGWSSASPSDDQRAEIIQIVLNKVRTELNGLRAPGSTEIKNLLYPIMDHGQSQEVKDIIISSIRKHWTLATNKLNRERPSGSITPAFPHLDRGGTFTVDIDKTSTYLPYAPNDEMIDSGPVVMQLDPVPVHLN